MQRDHAENGLTATSVGRPGPAGGQQECAMCLTCGCNDAHKSMGDNLTYEDVRKIAIANGKTVDQTLETMNATAAADKARHTDEYQRPSDAGRD